MKFGLTNEDIKYIQGVLKRYPQIQTALVFGSRAMGNQKKGSDIDIAIVGDIDLTLLGKIKSSLDEDIPLPYFFDVVDYQSIENPDLKKHIDQHGSTIYTQ